ncbi:hypothetical protein CTA1_8771 [Colletotrichum tanaceti]|uniref:Uncharacterized protein n=1 Tax=Colletotrichum tanaceti TaxID=1306861 RepID=A0A4U6XJ34_9PEZI|nr:hypothetical protein CTA1_8771 [Colletotrichum tanaceti]
MSTSTSHSSVAVPQSNSFALARRLRPGERKKQKTETCTRRPVALDSSLTRFCPTLLSYSKPLERAHQKSWTAQTSTHRAQPRTDPFETSSAPTEPASGLPRPRPRPLSVPITNVVFRDVLFRSSAVPSLGLECMTQRGDFNRWSLALSHLRYYGNPVKVKSEGLLQRVTGDQIWLIALGAILRQWQVDLSNLKDSVIWFGRVGTVIENASQRDAAEISWLRKMCKAVSPFSSASAQEQQILMSLVQFGHRRALRFLGSRGAVQRPYFGLCDLGMFGGNGKHRSVGDACKIAMVQDDAISIHRKRKVGTWTDAPPFSNIFGAHLELQSFRE